jgi:hypothetical protein
MTDDMKVALSLPLPSLSFRLIREASASTGQPPLNLQKPILYSIFCAVESLTYKNIRDCYHGSEEDLVASSPRSHSLTLTVLSPCSLSLSSTAGQLRPTAFTIQMVELLLLPPNTAATGHQHPQPLVSRLRASRSPPRGPSSSRRPLAP